MRAGCLGLVCKHARMCTCSGEQSVRPGAAACMRTGGRVAARYAAPWAVCKLPCCTSQDGGWALQVLVCTP